MYVCEQCGSSFSPIRIRSPEACPRCLVRKGVRVPLAFSPLFGVEKSMTDSAAVDSTATLSGPKERDDREESSLEETP